MDGGGFNLQGSRIANVMDLSLEDAFVAHVHDAEGGQS